MEDTHSYFAGTNEVWVHNYRIDGTKQYLTSKFESVTNWIKSDGFIDDITLTRRTEGLVASLKKAKKVEMRLAYFLIQKDF